MSKKIIMIVMIVVLMFISNAFASFDANNTNDSNNELFEFRMNFLEVYLEKPMKTLFNQLSQMPLTYSVLEYKRFDEQMNVKPTMTYNMCEGMVCESFDTNGQTFIGGYLNLIMQKLMKTTFVSVFIEYRKAGLSMNICEDLHLCKTMNYSV